MISIIILTWNSEKYIEKCIQSVLASEDLENQPIEIVVVDNGSTDATTRILASLQTKISQLTVVFLSKNKGTTHSRNIGIKKSSGEYILILDADVEVKKNTIAFLVKELRDDPTIGIIAPKLLYANGGVQPSCKKFPTVSTKIMKVLSTWFGIFTRTVACNEGYGFPTRKTSVDYCISACWLVRKSLFDEIGLFDERIFYAPEDVEFCARTWIAGHTVVYFPTAIATHYTQRVSYTRPTIALSHIKGLVYFFTKYRCWFSRRGLYNMMHRN